MEVEVDASLGIHGKLSQTKLCGVIFNTECPSSCCRCLLSAIFAIAKGIVRHLALTWAGQAFKLCRQASNAATQSLANSIDSSDRTDKF